MPLDFGTVPAGSFVREKSRLRLYSASAALRPEVLLVEAAFLGDSFAALPAPPVVPADFVAVRLFGDVVVAERFFAVVVFAEPFRAEVFRVAVVAEPFFAELLFAEPFFATFFFAPGRLTVRLRVVAMMAPWCE